MLWNGQVGSNPRFYHDHKTTDLSNEYPFKLFKDFRDFLARNIVKLSHVLKLRPLLAVFGLKLALN